MILQLVNILANVSYIKLGQPYRMQHFISSSAGLTSHSKGQHSPEEKKKKKGAVLNKNLLRAGVGG